MANPCSTIAVNTRSWRARDMHRRVPRAPIVAHMALTRFLTPTRQRGVEFLDDPAVDPRIASRSLQDVARANRWFGGTRAVLTELTTLLAASPATTPLVLLDVGTGLGDIPCKAREIAARRGHTLHTIGLELTPALAAGARARAGHSVCATALQLPFADQSVDVVTCSQVLHHFDTADAEQLLRELTRVARRAVIVSDLRRSWLAVGLLWVVSFPLAFHPVSRHDGVVSILRGFTSAELATTVRDVTGREARVRRQLGWRITATWATG